MKERPILFSGAMVRAILAGRKTQTRRIVADKFLACIDPELDDERASLIAGCPYGQPGDRLWVRETWAELDVNYHPAPGGGRVVYRADHITGNDGPDKIKWRPSIFMRREASRITLEVLAVRVERVQQIWTDHMHSDNHWADLFAEGIPQVTHWNGEGNLPTPLSLFINLWDSINGKRAPWASNPWVWVVEFKRVTA